MDWIFQCNPTRFNLDAALTASPDGSWTMNQHREKAVPGDRVFFWETGPNARMKAAGRITSPVYERTDENPFGKHAVDIIFEARIQPPITREEILEHPVLSQFRPFSWAMGTNIPIADEKIVAALDRLVRERIEPLGPPTARIDETVDYQKSLDDAIKRAERETIQALRRHIAEMDPTAFEWLVRALLLKLGYTNVEVTKRSNDGGIDVMANLAAGGLTMMKTAIQAKRMRSVGRPIIQALRGSLQAHQVGLVITSGRIVENALEDAQDPTKAPIACIDGYQLAKLLVEHRIGVERRVASIYTLRPEDLTLENLQDIAESNE
jgi:hypothetical protein